MEAALEVASNLRIEDRRELEEGHGVSVLSYFIQEGRRGSCKAFTVPNGKTAGLVGVEEDGNIWMLTTPAIEEYPITFARESKRFILSRKEPILWNKIDKRNTVHLKLLKFLGFKFLREITYGPNQLKFIEFYYVCKR